MPRRRPTLRSPFGERVRAGTGSERLVSRGAMVEAGPEHRTRHALRAAGDLSRAVVAGLQEGVVVCDAEGRALSWNESALRILGVDAERLAHRPPLAELFRERIHGGAAPPLEAGTDPVSRALATGEPVEEHLLRDDAGADAVIAVHARPIGSASSTDGGRGAVCTLQDVTSAVANDERVRRERDRAQRYLEVSGTIVVGLDPMGRVELFNRQGSEALGWSEEELLGRDWFELALPQGERLEARMAFTRIVEGVDAGGDSLETSVLTRTGQQRKIAWRSAAVRDDDGRIVSVLRSGEDVTERRRAEAQVAYLAYHDGLTGLPNRSMLEQQLRRDVLRARRRSGALAVLFLDLDDFKLVNDSLGHAAGDAVLLETGQRIAGAIRSGDLQARQGGDEFLVLLSDVDAADPTAAARAAAQAIVEALDRPFRVAGAEFHCGVSIGVAVFPDDGDDAETLLRHADSAMYRAKRDGGGVATYEESAGDARQRLSLTARLRRAITEGQLRLHYQPIVRISDGSVVAVEALVRWEDPVDGMIPPNDFIPAAESTGLIDRLGDWVVDELCAQGARWAAEGRHPHLGFNLSPLQLRNPDLAASILARVREHGLDPQQLRAELTESAIVTAEQGHHSPLEQLRAAGLQVALDDFGAGHSSLGRLRDLPVGELKVDRSFLRQVPGDRRAVALLSAALTVGRALEMTTVAEGVETASQYVLLGELGCDLAQGFLFGRPVPADELPAEVLDRMPDAPPPPAVDGPYLGPEPTELAEPVAAVPPVVAARPEPGDEVGPRPTDTLEPLTGPRP